MLHKDCDSATYGISVGHVASQCSKQKKGKAVGPDGVAMEAFMYGRTWVGCLV